MRRPGLIVLTTMLLAMPALGQASPMPDLPAGLATGEALAHGSGNIFDLFNPCTSSVFRLDDETARAIGQTGLAALDALSAGTGQHVPWTPTPVDLESRESWSQHGYIWAGLGCGLSADWRKKSHRTGTGPGAFYSFGDGVLLLVDPVERIVIYTRRDSLH